MHNAVEFSFVDLQKVEKKNKKIKNKKIKIKIKIKLKTKLCGYALSSGALFEVTVSERDKFIS